MFADTGRMDQRPVHLAIIHKRYLDAILEGTKTVEARISKVRCAPFGRVEAGDAIYLKQAGGPVRACAIASCVRTHEDLTREGLRGLRREWNDRIGGPGEYWSGRVGCRYATLIELAEVNAGVADTIQSDLLSQIPRGSRSGWHVLDRRAMRRAA